MLRVHFLNVGHGDCTIIKHPSGRLTMIDINNAQEYDPVTFDEVFAEREATGQVRAIAGAFGLPNALSTATLLGASQTPSPLETYFEVMDTGKRELTDPIEFLQKHYRGERLWRFILTHPDLDHMRGIRKLHENVGFDTFWDTSHTKTTPHFRNDADRDDWSFYQRLRQWQQGHRIYMRGHSLFAFARDEQGRTGGDNIEILSPTPDLVRTCNQAQESNNLSLVLRVHHAGKTVLLPGDAEEAAWDDIVRHYGSLLKSDFLKASHHGRDSGYHNDAVRLISPLLTFVSVGRKPDVDATGKYRQYSKRVASTRYHGNIELRIHDDGKHEWLVDKNWG